MAYQEMCGDVRPVGALLDMARIIAFIGLRSGEKLCEELVGTDATMEPSGVEKIFQVRAGWLPEPGVLAQQLTALERLGARGEASAILDLLCDVVPTFRPQDVPHHGGSVRKRIADAV